MEQAYRIAIRRFLSREIDILDLAHKRIHLVTRKAVA
jgi:hypothetical protein